MEKKMYLVIKKNGEIRKCIGREGLIAAKLGGGERIIDITNASEPLLASLYGYVEIKSIDDPNNTHDTCHADCKDLDEDDSLQVISEYLRNHLENFAFKTEKAKRISRIIKHMALILDEIRGD